MTTYTWDTGIYPTATSLAWLDNSARFQSALSGATRTVNRPGGRWRMTMSFQARKPVEAQKIEAFLWRLDGATHRAQLIDFSYERQGTGSGTPLVKGASQTGYSLITDGWSNSQTVLKAGDRFTVNNQLLLVATDATSDGSGNCTITLAHPLRSAPADNAPLTVTNPYGIFYLVEQVETAAQPGVFKSIDAVFEEEVA
jgi:hypothetical protein